jgi:hypothetical protein
LIILILAFGALVAALVPLILAITAVAAAIGLIGPISQVWPMEESIGSVVLLIGLAVSVDYSLFYLRREREERAAGRSEGAALEAAPATSGRAVLVSGITVIAAMAGMYLGGMDTFTSFATGTILVVAISVIGSLTVLPAILSKLGDRVNKGAVPWLRPEKRTREPRVWAALLDRVLKRPVVSLVAAGAVLVVLAIPVFHIHTAETGVDGLPRSLEVMRTYDRMQAAFPGEQFTADIVVEGRKLDRSEIQAAAQELRQVARGSDQFHEPVTVDTSRDGQVAVLEVPLAGSGTDDTSMNALNTLRPVPRHARWRPSGSLTRPVRSGELVEVETGSPGLPSRADRWSGGQAAPVLTRADAEFAFEGRAQRVGGAVADLAGGLVERDARVGQQVRGQREAPLGEVGHRRNADQLGEAPRQRRAGEPHRVAQRRHRPGACWVVVDQLDGSSGFRVLVCPAPSGSVRPGGGDVGPDGGHQGEVEQPVQHHALAGVVSLGLPDQQLDDAAVTG